VKEFHPLVGSIGWSIQVYAQEQLLIATKQNSHREDLSFAAEQDKTILKFVTINDPTT
jgi:hypothetical protein